jgi:hypothetical protein
VTAGEQLSLQAPATILDETYFLVSLQPATTTNAGATTTTSPIVPHPGAPPGWLYESHVAEAVLEEMLAEANVKIVRGNSGYLKQEAKYCSAYTSSRQADMHKMRSREWGGMLMQANTSVARTFVILLMFLLIRPHVPVLVLLLLVLMLVLLLVVPFLFILLAVVAVFFHFFFLLPSSFFFFFAVVFFCFLAATLRSCPNLVLVRGFLRFERVGLGYQSQAPSCNPSCRPAACQCQSQRHKHSP